MMKIIEDPKLQEMKGQEKMMKMHQNYIKIINIQKIMTKI